MENPNTYIAQQWLFAGILLVLTLGLATTMAFLPEIIGKVLRVQRPNAVKLQSYECGFTPVGQARVRFSIK
ncbi:MAG: NADH-quinone oxidoreductase subunit A, partial [Actinomycetota bacterium]